MKHQNNGITENFPLKGGGFVQRRINPKKSFLIFVNRPLFFYNGVTG